MCSYIHTLDLAKNEDEEWITWAYPNDDDCRKKKNVKKDAP